MAVLSAPDDILVEFLRAKLTDPRARIATETDSFTATAGQTEFVLTPATAAHLVRAITGVTKNSVALIKWQDYDIDLYNKKIILKTGATLSDAIVVTYKSSASGNEWIYPDFPIATMGTAKFPRISVTIVNMTAFRQGANVSSYLNQVHFQIDAWVKESYEYTLSGHDYNKQELANYLGYQAELALKNNINDLYTKLFDEEGLAFGPFPFDETTQTFRHKQEFVMSAINAGE
jgi:hypothetical protein